MYDTENNITRSIIGYDKYTETFSLHTKTKTHYKCDVTDQMFDFFAKIYDILTARGYPFGITYRQASVIFAYGKATGEVISDELKYTMCYKYLDEPKWFCDYFLN